METHNCNAHEQIVQEIKKHIIPDHELEEMSKLFKVISDNTRIKILYAITKHEVCVNDIAEILNMTQSAISHQLAVLKDLKLIKGRRDKQTIYYSVNDDHINLIFNMALDHIRE